jgi:hypothetical protein
VTVSLVRTYLTTRFSGRLRPQLSRQIPPDKRVLSECGNPKGLAGLVFRFWKCFQIRRTVRSRGVLY